MTVTPATAPASAERVKQLLVEGRTAQAVADLTGWPRQRIVALVNGVPGWLLDPEKDTVYQPGTKGMTPQLPDGIDPATARAPRAAAAPAAATPAGRVRGSVDALIEDAAGLRDPLVDKELGRVLDGLARLRAAVETVTERQAAQEAVAAATEALKQAKARLKTLGRRPSTTTAQTAPAAISAPGKDAPEVRAANQAVRAWAKEHGLECPQFGRIPDAVRAAYDKAHPGLAQQQA